MGNIYTGAELGNIAFTREDTMEALGNEFAISSDPQPRELITHRYYRNQNMSCSR